MRGRRVSQDVTADAGFLWGKAAMLGDTIKWTASKWEIGVCMREKKGRRRNAYCIIIGMLERNIEETLGKLQWG